MFEKLLRISRFVYVFDSDDGDGGGGEDGDGGRMIVAEVWAAWSRGLERCWNSGGSAAFLSWAEMENEVWTGLKEVEATTKMGLVKMEVEIVLLEK